MQITEGTADLITGNGIARAPLKARIDPPSTSKPARAGTPLKGARSKGKQAPQQNARRRASRRTRQNRSPHAWSPHAAVAQGTASVYGNADGSAGNSHQSAATAVQERDPTVHSFAPTGAHIGAVHPVQRKLEPAKPTAAAAQIVPPIASAQSKVVNQGPISAATHGGKSEPSAHGGPRRSTRLGLSAPPALPSSQAASHGPSQAEVAAANLVDPAGVTGAQGAVRAGAAMSDVPRPTPPANAARQSHSNAMSVLTLTTKPVADMSGEMSHIHCLKQPSSAD